MYFVCVNVCVCVVCVLLTTAVSSLWCVTATWVWIPLLKGSQWQHQDPGIKINKLNKSFIVSTPQPLPAALWPHLPAGHV